MLCPLKFTNRYSEVDNGYGVKIQVENNCECERNKCAWWIQTTRS